MVVAREAVRVAEVMVAGGGGDGGGVGGGAGGGGDGIGVGGGDGGGRNGGGGNGQSEVKAQSKRGQSCVPDRKALDHAISQSLLLSISSSE